MSINHIEMILIGNIWIKDKQTSFLKFGLSISEI